jgi:membrane-associated phospholipid phosphatase
VSGDAVTDVSDPHPAAEESPRGGSEPHGPFARFRPGWLSDDVVRGVRWAAVLVWAFLFVRTCYLYGIPYLRSDLLLWLSIGLVAGSIGKRALWTVVVDFVPFAAVLVVYDHVRGIADTLGMPTWWYPQADVDKALAFGAQPTVWLQEHLKYADVRWWDVVVALCYTSFFFLPYVTAAVMWLRSRRDFYRWSLRFVTLSFVGFGFFALIPAAPPWAAARCSAVDVAGHPSDPSCMYIGGPASSGGGLLGPMTHARHGADAWIERLSTRGLSELHLHFASAVLNTGQTSADLIAAVPSLHAGGIMLFTFFMWRRVSKWWRPALVAYNLLMAFTLVYSAEHYVSDILAGWLLAAVVAVSFDLLESRRAARATRSWAAKGSGMPAAVTENGEPDKGPEQVDTLKAPAPTASRMEN